MSQQAIEVGQHARVDAPGVATPLATRLLPGLFPPRPYDADAGVRRVLLALLLTLDAVGIAILVALTRDPALVAPFVVASFGLVVAAATPWHRLERDAFAVVGIGLVLWVVWLIFLTGGASSPYTPLTYLALAVVSIPIARRAGVALGLFAAFAAALPLAYQDDIRRDDAVAIAVRTAVLVTAAIFAPWLMEELRRAVRTATAERARYASDHEETAALKRTETARQEYLSVLAHELRNPLNAIHAAARVLARELADKAGEPTAKGIASEAHHALELLDGLTDVASLESGRLRLALRPIDLAAVVRETVGGAVEGHPILLRGADAGLHVLGDERRLSQVVRNLVSNAAKYSPPEAEIQLSLGISADRKSAIVQVRDHGPGIPPGERGRLYQKFARLSTAGGTRGSGLGLFISRGLVNDHRGEMWADWPAGGGSVFSFSVPLTGDERGS